MNYNWLGDQTLANIALPTSLAPAPLASRKPKMDPGKDSYLHARATDGSSV